MNIPRLPWDSYWMLLAHFTATRSTCDRGPELLFDPGRHGVGAVIVKNKRCIGGGYNGSAPNQPHCSTDPRQKSKAEGHILHHDHCVRTIHSEVNALIQCALDGVSPEGATLYTTASPCFDCAKAIVRAGIVKVFYGQKYESRYGLSDTVCEMLSLSNIEFEELVLSQNDFTKSILDVPQ